MYRPLDKMEKFNGGMDAELLANDFAYYDDWKYGPSSCWSGPDLYTLELMWHNYGYWLILRRHGGGENKEMNLGSSNYAKDIIAVRDALRRLW